MDESIHESEFPEINLRKNSAYRNFLKLNFEGSLTSEPASDIAGNRRVVVSSRNLSYFCIFFILAGVVCVMNSVKHSSCTSAMKETDRRAIGTERRGCGRMFGTLFAYDQHRRSRVLRRMACRALPNENRFNVTAAQRPNMSTAALESRPAKRTQGGEQQKHILHILQIIHMIHIATISNGPVLRLNILYYFNSLNMHYFNRDDCSGASGAQRPPFHTSAFKLQSKLSIPF
jgi:hypothetical protein